MDDAKRKQVALQCKSVVHLAKALMEVHSDYARMLDDPACKIDKIVDQVGARTASFMETLGNMLNAMDAVEESDDWMKPVFREAQRLWPPTDTGSVM